MLGTYENFPQTVHKTAGFTASVSSKKVQQTLIQTLHEINGKAFNLEDIADPSVPKCTVIFELGIAETNDFNYLDEEETNKMLRILQKTPLQTMDFYCAIRYYKVQNEKKTPLRFDYYLIRFIFNKNLTETHVFHEKGPRHVSSKDIIDLVEDKINSKSSKKILKPL